MTLYIKCPGDLNSPEGLKRKILVEEAVSKLRSYGVPYVIIVPEGPIQHYFLSTKGLSPQITATADILMSELNKKDPKIKTRIYDMATEALRKAVEAGKIRL